MIQMLGHHLNKVLLVSIPTLFGDDHPRACTLTGIEAAGLWLESQDLAKKLLPADDERASASIFVPFPQIAYLLEPGVDKHAKPAPRRHTEASGIGDKEAKGDVHKKRHRPG